jgi:hypothetical protein
VSSSASISTVRVFPSPNSTPPSAFFAPKYALTPAAARGRQRERRRDGDAERLPRSKVRVHA